MSELDQGNSRAEEPLMTETPGEVALSEAKISIGKVEEKADDVQSDINF